MQAQQYEGYVITDEIRIGSVRYIDKVFCLQFVAFQFHSLHTSTVVRAS